MSTTQTIESAVIEFLAECGVSFSVQLVGPTKREDWECDEWRFTLKNARAEYVSQFFTGAGHRVDTAASKLARAALKNADHNSIAWQDMLKMKKPKAPHIESVLYSLVMDGEAVSMSFIDWCSDFGYSEDSRKALATYEACCECGRKLRNLFTPVQREKLAGILREY